MRREVGKSGLATFEFVRIQGLPSGAVYFSGPVSRPQAQFQLATSDGASATFENLGHPYPQRISYKLEGDELHARVEGEVRGILQWKELVLRRSARGLEALAPESEAQAD
jgi:hypothetical protein